MINALKLSLFSAAFLTLAATTGFAQTNGSFTANVPFQFTAGDVTLPAGDYNFDRDQAGVVTISSKSTNKSVMVLTSADAVLNSDDQPRLKFDKSNGVYSLTRIAIAGESDRLVGKQ